MNAIRIGAHELGRTRVPRLVIAAGSEYATTVLDARELGPWIPPSMPDIRGREYAIYWHHTVLAPTVPFTMAQELAWLQLHVKTLPFGWPYNFVVSDHYPFRAWYLNSVENPSPHTYGHNRAVAIAALGNYDVQEPPTGLVVKMWRLADAIATMDGRYEPEYCHGDVFPTACPGRFLREALRR